MCFGDVFLAATGKLLVSVNVRRRDWAAMLAPFPTAKKVAWGVILCPQIAFLWLLFHFKPCPPHFKTSVAKFEFLPILYLYNFFAVVAGGCIDSPGAVSILGWHFEMNNYLAIAQLLLFVK